jgi:predicted unusual protein kinase regulating ubiquinone biosynthesis (AarF/ABC1/UbiB family)
MESAQALGTLGFFRALEAEQLERVVSRCQERRYASGDSIVEEGGLGTGLFVLVEGRAEVAKVVQGRATHVLGKLEAGDHFGEMSLVTADPIAATVRALGEARCLHLPKSAFLELLESDSNLARRVLWVFVQRLAKNLSTTDASLVRALRMRERGETLRHVLGLLWMESLIFWSYVWAWFRASLLRLPLSVEQRSRLHRRNARRFKRTAFRLRGANVKVGQLASMQSHVLPPEYIEEFREMRDRVAPTEYPLIASLIESELGGSPLTIFEEFERVPIATASMGQVHAARLRTGEKVVVKVQHPGLERSVDVDMFLLRLMARTASRFVKSIDLMQMMQETEEPLRRELDLMQEGKATEALGRELAQLGVIVPKVYWRYTTRRVLVMEFIEGVNVDRREQLEAWKVDRRALMSVYAAAFLKQAFEGGLFHADPHPGNCFCTPEGKLALLDFGMVKTLPANVRRGLLKELLGSFFNHPGLYTDGLIEKGMFGEEDRQLLETWAATALADPTARAVIFDHRVEKKGDVQTVFGAIGDMCKSAKTFQTPRDNLMFMRAIGIVVDVCKEVVPEVPVSQLVAPVMMPLMATFMNENPKYATLLFSPSAQSALASAQAAPPAGTNSGLRAAAHE